MTKPKRYKRYSSEFKREAIRRASEEGITDAAVWPSVGDSHPVAPPISPIDLLAAEL